MAVTPADGFGARVTYVLEALDVTKTELAQRIGCSVSYITKLTRESKRNPSADFLKKFVAVTNADMDWLVHDGELPDPKSFRLRQRAEADAGGSAAPARILNDQELRDEIARYGNLSSLLSDYIDAVDWGPEDGRRLSHKRHVLGMTVAQLAEAVEVPPRELQEAEHGSRTPNLRLLRAVDDLLIERAYEAGLNEDQREHLIGRVCRAALAVHQDPKAQEALDVLREHVSDATAWEMLVRRKLFPNSGSDTP